MIPRSLPGQPIRLQQWRQFVSLARHLNFGRAAASLGMTQPPLTMAIQRLEFALGVTLFQRDLLPAVEQLLAQAQALPELARAAQDGQSGHVRLGFVSTVGFGPLPGWLRGFREGWPAIAITLKEATSDVQWLAFERRELDAGLVLHVPQVVPPGLGVRRVLREPLVLAFPQAHPLARRRSLSQSDVLAEPLVIFPRAIAPTLFDDIAAMYQPQALGLQIAQEAVQMQTIVNLVSAGLGVAWVPRSVSLLRRPGVVYRAVPGAWSGPQPFSETRLVWRQDAGPATRRLVDHVLGHPTRAMAR